MLCKKAVDIFMDAYGSEAGTAALKWLPCAQGGEEPRCVSHARCRRWRRRLRRASSLQPTQLSTPACSPLLPPFLDPIAAATAASTSRAASRPRTRTGARTDSQRHPLHLRHLPTPLPPLTHNPHTPFPFPRRFAHDSQRQPSTSAIFQRAFFDKGRMTPLLLQIPVYIVKVEDTGTQPASVGVERLCA